MKERYYPYAVGGFALALRLLYLWQIHDDPALALRMGDGLAYHEWAQRIAAGEWIGQGVFYQAPLYPYFLAIIYSVLGDDIVTVRVIQAFLGAVSCGLLAAAGVALFGTRGSLAGVGLALYAPAIFLDGLVEKSSLVTLFTIALLAVLCSPPERMTVRRWVGVGAILGLLTLTRENALILAAPVLLMIGRRWRPAVAFLAGCALVLLPVGLRNLAVGGEFHLTTSQLGPNFYIGNHQGANGTYEALIVGHGNAADEREDATFLAEQASGRKLTPGEVSTFWINKSLDYIRSQPIGWLKLMARKIALIFNVAEVSDTESQDVFAESSWLLRVLQPIGFGLLLGVAVLGAILNWSEWRRLLFLYAIGAAYAASVALFFILARYRFPIVPILMLLAAGGLIEAANAWRERQLRRLSVAASVALLAVAFAYLPLESAEAARAIHYLNIGRAFDNEQAGKYYQRALAAQPEFPAAHLAVGVQLAREGKPADAIPHYRAALAVWPAYAEARYNLGLALAVEGQRIEATQEFEQALRLRPGDADTHFALAKTQLALNRPDLAAGNYEQGLKSRPKDAKALSGWGVALTQMGRADQAIEKYRQALEIDPEDAATHNNLGWTLASQERVAEAVPHFERALALNPGHENARRNLDQARQILSRK